MRQIICAAAAVLTVVTVGCSPRDRRETGSTLDSTAGEIGRDVEQGAREARDEIREYSYDRRAEFRRDPDEDEKNDRQDPIELRRAPSGP